MKDSASGHAPSDRDAEIRDWLTAAVGAGFRTEPASSDASFRRYLRVFTPGTTLVLMDAPPAQEDCRPFVHVRALLEAAGVSVPGIIEADLGKGLLLLTDLGSRSYLDVLDQDNCETLYGDALSALRRMQTKVPAGEVAPYDALKLRAELDLFPRWFLGRHLGIEVSGALERAMESCFTALIERCLEQPQVFVHRDYHSRNLMFLHSGNPGVLDFQDAVRGPVTYDLVSLFRDVYIEWPRRRVEEWVAGYHQSLGAELAPVAAADPGRFLEWFDLTGVHRHIKVAGIFCRLWHRDGKRRYLADVPLTLRYLMTVGARYPECADFIAALESLEVVKRFAAAGDSKP